MPDDAEVKSVLILLNDPTNSRSIFEMVSELGHSPIEIGDIETAREYIRDYAIDAVVFSPNMYETSGQRDVLPIENAGFKFASELRKQHPDIKWGYYALYPGNQSEHPDILKVCYHIPFSDTEAGLHVLLKS